MNFNSWQFVLFFFVVFALTARLKRYSTANKCILLVASYFFYGSWNWHFLALIAFSTVFDFWIGLHFGRTQHPRRLIAFSVIANLGVLAFFKYANFAIASANWSLAAFGSAYQFHAVDVLLPVGISFYTFQSMSYTIDVYRGDLAARKSLLDYALFVAFFPQLVAGPIVRASEFFQELDHPRHFTHKQIAYALILIAFGYVKKVVFADSLAEAADPVWNNLASSDPWAVLLAVYAFAFQIYFDFSGYTDIAIGVAMLFGFQFPKNFDYPYIATSIQEFWRRWHMTLSRWLRDYLYIALGGNRKGPALTYFNLMLTMLLGGLWHGASWNFVIWGALHGGYLVFERLVLNRIPGWQSAAVSMRLLRWFVTFHMVCFAWIFFRANDLTESLLAISKLTSLAQASFDPQLLATLAMALCAFQIAHWLGGRFDIKQKLGDASLPIHVAASTAALLTLIWFTPNYSAPFIYFQF
jgi:alginate O-acetyltransferase complex protein AlgI